MCTSRQSLVFDPCGQGTLEANAVVSKALRKSRFVVCLESTYSALILN